MKGYHAATGAPRRRHGRPRLTDVYRSDFLQDSGTPLQWLCAWEVVETRERAEALARLAVVLTITMGLPIDFAGVVRLAATLKAEA
jgi:hypothetical protein